MQNSVLVCRRPERHRRVFSLCDPPVPSRRLNLNAPNGLRGQSGELPVHTLRHSHALMLSWSDVPQSAGERETPGVSPYSGPSKMSSEEVECQMEAL